MNYDVISLFKSQAATARINTKLFHKESKLSNKKEGRKVEEQIHIAREMHRDGPVQ